jgi:hypothetical protein
MAISWFGPKSSKTFVVSLWNEKAKIWLVLSFLSSLKVSIIYHRNDFCVSLVSLGRQFVNEYPGHMRKETSTNWDVGLMILEQQVQACLSIVIVFSKTCIFIKRKQSSKL